MICYERTEDALDINSSKIQLTDIDGVHHSNALENKKANIESSKYEICR